MLAAITPVLATTPGQAAQGLGNAACKSYVLGPSASDVHAVRAEGRGDVKHPQSLTSSHGPATTLTTVAGGTPASVLLDFGQEIGGTPYLEPTRVTGAPALTLVTSEARQYIRTPAATTVPSAVPSGSTQVPLASAANLETGNTITFTAAGGTPVTRTITAFDTTARTATVTPPLSADLPAGTAVKTSPGAPSSDESRGLAGVGGPDTFQPTAAGRLTGGFHGGFRFALLTVSTPGSVSLSSLGVTFQAFRATTADYQGWFLSSDDQLNRMWYSGAYTLQMNLKAPGLNGLPDARIYDGAKRDRSIWTGDLLVQIPTLLTSLGTAGAPYVKSSLDTLLATQRADGAFPGSPDFAKRTNPAGSPLFYSNNYSGYGLRAFIDYYRYTGDKAYVTAVLPALRKELAYNDSFRNADNLVVSNDRDYWQATQTGEVTKYSIDYSIVLREMSWLERAVGSAALADGYDTKADAIKTAVMSKLWNPALGAYGQSSAKPDVLVEDANALALQYGFVPAGQEAKVLAALKTLWTPYGAIMGPGLQDPTGHTIEPFGNGMETAGRFAAGDTAGALDLVRRTWGPVVDPRNPLYTGAFWEFKNSTGGVNRATASLAHGWAASPSVQLTEQLLGIKPVGAGYQTWSIAPNPGTVRSAAGAVPTAYGTIKTQWTSDSRSGRFTLTVQAPAGTSGTITVPAGRGSVVTVNGRDSGPRAKSTGDSATLTVSGGSYQITVSQG
ncbi:alpha-L-rhamnosidase [Amycolatopsis mediterranei S699]|uniref:Alpha-L-rhamnosidase n=2 Tax=Amycolatopsis mediterranei TaxID=33910 RepID=A0A0H3DBT2_AMYMU|nr:alpha-L-rhamnosidase C-terminal domain-containing protein [Amycolatopsis mediterranei]ADJ47523.1 alpha-L-rhamnosidase [Amycolatopsis mediterranei U32]AEK44381.1 alpha-L-rhamnosidase [Amycolatopsis mediterranei S699]AFO79234.1 alpha-L-rhamnosidase [Amycolatopsis mediterranei S699]AGT86362.1 alpha-L-rhamnosidase [Amycolatopsis mediterranei RB]KDO12549.1 alpha-L-rhamnosidase [Amycolatopsis mediterranei]